MISLRALTASLILMTVGLCAGLAFYAGGQTAVTPAHVDEPYYDVYVPQSCAGWVQGQIPHHDTTLSVQKFLAFKQQLAKCGGTLVEKKGH